MFQILRDIIFPWIFFCSCRIVVSSFTYLSCLVASSENLNWIFNQFKCFFFFLFLILFAWSDHFFLFNLFFLFLPYSSRLFVDANIGIVRFQDCQNLACQIFIPQYVLAWLILPRSYSSIRTTSNSDFICFGPAWLGFNVLLLGFAIPWGHNFTHISGMRFQGTVLLWNSPNNSWSILLW